MDDTAIFAAWNTKIRWNQTIDVKHQIHIELNNRCYDFF